MSTTETEPVGIRAGGTVMPGRYDGSLLLKPDDTQAARPQMRWLTIRSAGIWRSADFTDIHRVWTDQPEPLPGPRIGPNGKHFPWGPIDAVWDVGEEYQIVQFRRDTSGHVQPEVWESHGKTRFHPYINGRDTSRTYDSMDAALVGVIAYKREGPNSQAARYFDRMTLKGIERED